MKKIKSMVKTSAATMGLLHCINLWIDSNSKAATNTKYQGKFFNWKHGSIFYKVIGQGKPLLLVHDLTVFSSGYEWSQVVNSLSKRYTVYTIDLIGCGRSDKPAITYTNYFYVQLLQDFVTEIIGEKTIVAASGLSTSFVLMANSVNNNLFSDIILINPSPMSELRQAPNRYSDALIRLFAFPVIGKSLYYMLTNRENTEYDLIEKCFYSPFKLRPQMTKAYYNAAHTSRGNGKMLFASLKGHYLNINISKALTDANNRIFLITGEKIEKREQLERSYLNLNSSITAYCVPQTKYLPQMEAPEQFLSLLNAL